MTDAFVHPVDGTPLQADLPTLNTAVDETWQEIDRLKQAVRPLQERRSELRGPAVLPKRRHQTPLQNVVAACPRCSGPVGGEAA